MDKRINVNSGRPLEEKAQYSRALRVNELVVQSGTTAIDQKGNILGDDVQTQIAAILDISKKSMSAAGGEFKNIVRSRLFVVGQENLLLAEKTFSEIFIGQSIATTVIPVARLARPSQLIEIELEAIDGEMVPRTMIVKTDALWTPTGRTCGNRVGNKVFLSGGSAPGRTVESQTKQCLKSIASLLKNAGAQIDDLVSLRVAVSSALYKDKMLKTLVAELKGTRPVITLLVTPSFQIDNTFVSIEAEAYIGAEKRAQRKPHPHLEGFSSTIAIDDQIYIGNIEYLSPGGASLAPNDWGEQRNGCTSLLQDTLRETGASLDDVIVRRYYTAAHAEMNSDYGDGPAWFAKSRPAALGCRITENSAPDVVLSLEAHAIRGAGNDIQWVTLS